MWILLVKFHVGLEVWDTVLSNLLSKVKGPDGIGWGILFAFTCWYLWKWRNKQVFSEEEGLPFNSRDGIYAAVVEWVNSISIPGQKLDRMHIFLPWDPPIVG